MAPYDRPAVKRLFDLVVSVIGLVTLSPLFLVVAILVGLDSRGPIVHRARRAGRFGREFTMYKFRTMTMMGGADGPRITASTDPRITRIGGVLRRTKLDELPQLWNVLFGDMSIVGPRPEDPHYVALYRGDQRRVLSVRPGLTSLASVRFRNESELLVGSEWETTYVNVVMPAKLAVDVYYVDHRTLWLDLTIIARTLASLAR